MNLEDIASWSTTILGFGLKASPIVLYYQIARGNKKIAKKILKDLKKNGGLQEYLEGILFNLFLPFISCKKNPVNKQW